MAHQTQTIFETTERDINNETTQDDQQISQFRDMSDIMISSELSSYKAFNPYKETSLIDFLERPQLVTSIQWTSAQSQVLLQSLVFPDILFNIPSIFNKINNFTYFSADINIMFRVNATRYHYGMLMATAVPNGLNQCLTWTDSTTVGFSMNGSIDNMISLSQMQHVEIIPTCNCVQELKIPWTLPFNYLEVENWTTGRATLTQALPARVMMNMAVVPIFVVNPLSANDLSPPPVTVNVYANFSNVKLAGYSAANFPYVNDPYSFSWTTGTYKINNTVNSSIEAQSNIKFEKDKKERSNIKETISKFIKTIPIIGDISISASHVGHGVQNASANINNTVNATIEAQSNIKFETIDPKVEVKDKVEGRVEKVARKISKYAGKMREIPIIGDVASAVSYVAHGVQNVARWFGWSLPIDTTPSSTMIIRYQDFCQADGVSPAKVLGMSQDNHIDPDFERMGSYPMEMAIIDIISHPTLLFTQSTVANLIYSIPVRPLIMPYLNGVIAGNVTVYHTALSKVASCFTFWRGTINYRIQFIASSFHSARYRIEWHPSPLSATTQGTAEMQIINKVVDISTVSEVDIAIPFLSSQPYLVNSYQSWLYGTNSNSQINNIDNGVLTIRQLTAMAHPSSPIPPIFVNIWISGGADMQFAKPTGQFINSVYQLTNQTSNLEAQSNIKFESLIPSTTQRQEGLLFGEEYTSIKQLICRSSPMIIPVIASTYRIAWNAPFRTSTMWSAQTVSFKDWFSTSFRWAKGSMKYKHLPSVLVDNDQNDGTMFCYASSEVPIIGNQTRVTVSAVTQVKVLGASTDNFIYFPDVQQIQREVMLPYYTPSFFLPNSFGLTAALTMSAPVLYLNTTVATNSLLYEACGDDFVYGNFIGSPAYVYTMVMN